MGWMWFLRWIILLWTQYEVIMRQHKKTVRSLFRPVPTALNEGSIYDTNQACCRCRTKTGSGIVLPDQFCQQPEGLWKRRKEQGWWRKQRRWCRRVMETEERREWRTWKELWRVKICSPVDMCLLSGPKPVRETGETEVPHAETSFWFHKDSYKCRKVQLSHLTVQL